MLDRKTFLAVEQFNGYDAYSHEIALNARVVIVVGAGPTAPDSYDWIRAQTDAIVVASSPMLLPLQRAGITPTVTCVVDPGHPIAMHFRGADTSQALVYHHDVIGSIKRDWKGTRWRLPNSPGPSVINACVQIAAQRGPKPPEGTEVHLIGADFCYPNGISHAPGVVTAFELDKSNCVLAANGNSEDVLTERSLLQFRDALEQQILGYDGVKFIKHGRAGLPVVGAEWFDG